MTTYRFVIRLNKSLENEAIVDICAESIDSAIAEILEKYPPMTYKIVSCIKNYRVGYGGTLYDSIMLHNKIKSIINNKYDKH